MAEVKNGSFNTGSYDGSYSTWPHYCTFSWTLSKQDAESNTSTITWSVKMAGGYSGYYNTIHKWLISINGEEYSSRQAVILDNGEQVYSDTTTVFHENDGSLKLSVSAKFAFYQNNGYNSTGSGSWELPKLARVAIISPVKDTYIGNPCYVTWDNVPGCDYKLRFKLGDFVYTTPNFDEINLDGTEVGKCTYVQKFNESDCKKLYDEISDSTYGIMTVILGTYITSTKKFVGSSQTTFKLKVPNNVTPIIKSSPKPIEVGYTKNINMLVQDYNKLVFNVNFASFVAGTGALIDNCTLSGPGLTTPKGVQVPDTDDGTSTVECGPISQTGNLQYTLTVYDSRGRSASVTTSKIKCHPHENPKLKLFNVFRCNSDGTPNQNGNYAKCTCVFERNQIIDSNNKDTNYVKIQIYHKQSSLTNTYKSQTLKEGSLDDTFDDVIQDNDGNPISFDSSKIYKFYVKITDTYGGAVKSEEVVILNEFRSINITPDGSGIALGKMAESKELLDSKWPIMAEGFRIPQILTGAVEITPTEANKPISKSITFKPEFSEIPNVVVTPHTKVPGTSVLGCGVYDITKSGAQIYLTRDNNQKTTISWIAMYSPPLQSE